MLHSNKTSVIYLLLRRTRLATTMWTKSTSTQHGVFGSQPNKWPTPSCALIGNILTSLLFNTSYGVLMCILTWRANFALKTIQGSK